MVRLKHRYLVLDILYPSEPSSPKSFVPTLLEFHRPTHGSVDIPHLLRLIRSSVEYMYGDYGLGLISSSLKIVYFSPATSTAIIRVARAHYRILWAGLTWMTGMGDVKGPKKGKDVGAGDCVFRVVRLCGTIRKAEEEVTSRAKREIRMAKSAESMDHDSLSGLLANPQTETSGLGTSKRMTKTAEKQPSIDRGFESVEEKDLG